MADSDTYEFKAQKDVMFDIPQPFNRTGYQFKYWTLTSEDSEESYDGTEEEFSEDTDLYAQWTANTYKVRFNANGGTGTMQDQPFTYDEEKTLTSNAFTKPGYSYRGWARTGSAQTPEYSNGGRVRNLTSTNNGIVNLFAIWGINTYTVTFEPHVQGMAIAPKTVNYNEEVGTLPTPSKVGHTLAGWFTEQTGGNQISSSTKVTDDVTFHAQWTQNTYTVTFNSNGSGSAVSPDSKTVTYGQTYGALPTPTRTVTGITYSFTGWYTEANNGNQITESDTVSITSQQTLYAHWTQSANTYTVTLNKQLGIGGTSQVTATYDAAMPSITTPTRTGYVFGGYYDGENGAGTKYYNDDGTSARTWDKTSNTTLHAKWIEDRIEVTYYRNFTEQEQEDTEN